MKRRIEVGVSIAPAAERKIWCWTLASDVEISGLGAIESVGRSIVIPDLVRLPSQKGSFGHTELDDDAIAELQVEYAQSGRRLGFHFHSHCRMEAFFSELDDHNFSKLARFGAPFVAAVFNAHGQVRWRVLTSDGILVEWSAVVEGDEPSKTEIRTAEEEVKQVVRADDSSYWLKYLGDYRPRGVTR